MKKINMMELIELNKKRTNFEKQKKNIENSYRKDEEFLDRELDRIYKALKRIDKRKKEEIKKLENDFNSKTNIENFIEDNPITNKDLIRYLNETRGGNWAFYGGEVSVRLYYMDHSYERHFGFLAGFYNKSEFGQDIRNIVFNCEEEKAEKINKALREGGINENYIGILPFLLKLSKYDMDFFDGDKSNVLDAADDIEVQLPSNHNGYLGITSYEELYRVLGNQNWTYFFLNDWKQIDYRSLYCYCDFKPKSNLNFDTGVKELVNEYIQYELKKQVAEEKEQIVKERISKPKSRIVCDEFEIPY